RTGVLAGSALLIAACSALFASAYLKASHQTAVLAVAHSVPQGSFVYAGDLTVVHISTSGRLFPIPSADASRVVGRRAAVALVPGSLLTMGDLSGTAPVPKGLAVVGVEVKSAQLPAEGVASGESVDVVLTGVAGAPAFAPDAPALVPLGGPVPSNSTAANVPEATGTSNGADQSAGTDSSGAQAPSLAATVLAPGALVTHSAEPTATSSGTTDVSLLVPIAVAPVVASASAAGQVALIAVTAP
ncbi:MAG TPA: SAF domain-containing protein, partial [Acidimicrobiales bacterium]|nr:SAF domain-containing protein [Acidimicrobiales bacterium]